MSSLPILGLYVVPAILLFGGTIMILRITKTTLILPFEYGTWLLPGFVYWLIPIVIYELRWYGIGLEGPSKTLANLFEPVLVAVVYWVVFIARLAVAKSRPEINQRAALYCIGAGIAIAVAITFLLPVLAE